MNRNDMVLRQTKHWQLVQQKAAGTNFYFIQKIGWKSAWHSRSRQYALRKWRRFVRKNNLTERPVLNRKEIMANLIEKLAALEHEQWACWTEHLLANLTEENVARWRGQIAASYADLTEEEKDNDREWAHRTWDVVLEHFAQQGM